MIPVYIPKTATYSEFTIGVIIGRCGFTYTPEIKTRRVRFLFENRHYFELFLQNEQDVILLKLQIEQALTFNALQNQCFEVIQNRIKYKPDFPKITDYFMDPGTPHSGDFEIKELLQILNDRFDYFVQHTLFEPI